ncbi:MAG: hypothetical protein ACTMH4_15090, partial [Sphingobacterium sp.]
VAGRWQWEAIGEVTFVVKANTLEISLPKKLLGISGSVLDLEFKWNDNMQEIGNIMDFYVNGDTAPGGRFNFIYNTSK